MTCCAVGIATASELGPNATGPSMEELQLASHRIADGTYQTDLSVPGIHCGGCIQAIETALMRLDNVERARVNLSTKRVSVRWHGRTPPPIIATLERLGYEAHLFEAAAKAHDDTLSELIRGMAIAGFAAMNIMLLSVSVWSGADAATRDLFHWVSALIALPALAFSGRIFFRSAWSALRHGRTNMDVPIVIGVSLAYALSLYETINHGAHAYFDASVSLLFFLLIGRTLDHVMRERARTAVMGLARMAPLGAMVVREDGGHEYLPLAEIGPGMKVLVAAGERIPVDGCVRRGTTELDCALVTGESDPQTVAAGNMVRAGTLNLTQPITIEVSAAANQSFLAEMIRLMEAAEGGRARYRRIADRASALYAPLVHLTAFLTFLGWMAVSGDWHQSVTIAIAVLIITCPCALGLAVPIVQVVAARRLFENGIMVKDGSAMERLAEIDTVVFDKTGTLTLGRPRLINAEEINRKAFAIAAAMADHSRHPISQALREIAAKHHLSPIPLTSVEESPGCGLEAKAGDVVYRLGRANWATAGISSSVGTVLSRNGEEIATFKFEDVLRRDAEVAVAELKDAGLAVEMLSGDRRDAVQSVGDKLAIARADAEALPSEKATRLAELTAAGHKALMVGDGLNDAPALAMAHVAMAPATAADIGRNAADFVFLRESLTAVPFALDVSKKSGALIRQNFAIAIAYNAVAVPIAVAGYVTPLVAAVAMSLSSLIVIGNAMRLRGRPMREAKHTGKAKSRAPLRANALVEG
ncbi:Nitrogen fixation protein FixI [Candidatus Filomicrobium marinum]|uniref:Nitrogen fixation protein FixI n=1 Tax=Candidatus Filomicrobium marinum TaxID=1608628 RepID=A0A0D6JH67_9HYPH|nr:MULTISPECIES: cation-translocating P-type ATPase [Filomicrobium]MCV0369542.1 cadmium-translocating P-type ATPase [Filomicrobium sp.]CFX44726.1 Nitrogen fixation protein FixI [Candidatus Filomicrobium marinum]CPR20835.1 Nitrogen fixation protein FixI [Candidatus Filomicrobium marinum]